MALPTRVLGRTGVEVTTLGYGAMELRGVPRGPDISDEDAERVLGAVLDGGINLIDTSIDYGHSEERIGRFIGHRRDEYFLASKCGCIIGDPPPGATFPLAHDFREENIRQGIEQSLTRLRTDHLDLLQVHMSPSRATLEEHDVVGTLTSLRDEGKVRFIGMSGTLPDLNDHIAMGVFDVFQIPYSALQREHEDAMDAAAKSGAGVFVRGGAARGVGAADKGWGRGPIGLGEGEAARRHAEADLEDLLGEMDWMEFVLRFTLSHPALSTTIVGTSNPDHLAKNLAVAAKGPLPEDLYEEAKRRLPKPA